MEDRKLGEVNNSVTGGATDLVVQAGQVRNMYVGSRVPPTRWPQRIGVVPALAGSFQPRGLIPIPEPGEALGAAWVLSGMGGVGKTQVAADYAQRVWSAREIELLVWVEASSRQAILSTYAAAATQLGWHTDEQPDVAAARFLDGLAALSKRWLIVLDDLQSPGDVRGLWPPNTSMGTVLATSRRREDALTGHRRTPVPVDVFTPSESLNYLTARFGDHVSRLAGAAELTAELGHLPLALAQAAAYIVDEDLDCYTYRALLADQRRKLADLVPEPDALPDDHCDPVAETWSLSVALADRQRPCGLASRVLEVSALLDSQGVPVEVFTTPAVQGHFAHCFGSEVTSHVIRSAYRVLHRLSLVTDHHPHESSHVLRVHGLVQRATRESLADSQLADLARIVADSLTHIWPEIERGADHLRILHANATALHRHAHLQLYVPDVHPVLFRLGTSLGQGGLLDAAIGHFSHMHATTEQFLGSDHQDTLAARNYLAMWRGDAGDLSGSLIEFRQILNDRLRRWGPDDPATLVARNNLAMCRGKSGDVAGAVVELERLLGDVIRVLGASHPAALATRRNLAGCRDNAGDVAGAVVELEQLRADSVRIMGLDHPDTLTVRNNLAMCWGNAGSVAKAVEELKRVAADRLRILGPKHPGTLTVRHNLARFRGEAGDAVEAVAELKRLLSDSVQSLGLNHPDTLAIRHTLATYQCRAGDAGGAVVEFERVLADRLQVLDPDHPDTFATRNSLAKCRAETGDVAGAMVELERLLADSMRVLGPDHPGTLAVRNNLAIDRASTGDFAGAVVELERLLADSMRVLGPEHPGTLNTRNNLAKCRRENES